MKNRGSFIFAAIIAASCLASGCATLASSHENIEKYFKESLPSVKTADEFDRLYAKTRGYIASWGKKQDYSAQSTAYSIINLAQLYLYRTPGKLGLALNCEALNADIVAAGISRNQFWIGAAVESADTAFARILVDNGYDFSRKLPLSYRLSTTYFNNALDNCSPLMTMAALGQRDTFLCFLLKAFYRENAELAFVTAVLNKRLDTAKAVFSDFPSCIDYKDRTWGGILHRAVYGGDLGMVDALIRMGAPDIRSGSYGYATDFAWSLNKRDIVARLRASNYKAEQFLAQIQKAEADYAAAKAEKARVAAYKTATENMACMYMLKLSMPSYSYSDSRIEGWGTSLEKKVTTTTTVTGSVKAHYLIGYKDGSVSIYSPYRFDPAKLDYEQMSDIPEGKIVDGEIVIRGLRLTMGKTVHDSYADKAKFLAGWVNEVDEKDVAFSVIQKTDKATKDEWNGVIVHAQFADFSIEVSRVF